MKKFILILILIVILVSSCDLFSSTNPLVGDWKVTFNEGYMKFVFNSDGTGLLVVFSYTDGTQVGSILWISDETTLTLINPYTKYAYTYIYSLDSSKTRLTLTDPVNPSTFIMIRQKK